ncbi:MAG: hypothetical protein Q8Q60_03620 [Candidatus Chromulinivorax sp.]|nr:hypothetical protein [Candidatus Chromulinivorax sp.]
MKKHIKSVFLTGIILLYPLTTPAFGIRDFLQCFDLVKQDATKDAVRAIASAAVVTTTSLGYSAINGIFASNELEVLPHRTSSELSHVAKNSKLDDEIAQELNNAALTNSASKLIMTSGDTGSGKSTTAEIIAAHVEATGLYTIPKSRLSAKTKNFMGKTDDDNKIAVLYDIADQISAVTPVGKKAVIHLEEFGTEFLAAGPNVEAWRDFTGTIMGDGDRAPRYPNIIFVASSNVDETKPHQILDKAIAARTIQKKLNNPDRNGRIEFFRTSAINIEQNTQKNAREQIATAGKPTPTIFEFIQSFIQPKAYNNAQQENKNNFFRENLLVTDAMLTQAKEQHEDKINTLQQEAQAVKAPWTLASLIIPSVRYNYLVRNAEAQYIESKIKNLKKEGYTPEVVTHNLTDMNKHDVNFLAEKTTKIDKQTTGLRKLNEVCLKNGAQTQELKFINAIKKHLDEKESDEVTAQSNPQLFDMMNNHRKFCSQTLSQNADTAETKVLAKLPTDFISSYSIDPTTRTYTCTTATPQPKSSGPITFGAITKAHIAAAAYGDDFASYNKKDAAASTVAKNWKTKREHIKSTVERKKALQNMPAID